MSSRTQAEDSLDTAIPPWKRELILRRRALLARTHGGIPTPGSGGALNSAAASLLVAGHSGAVKTAAAAFSAISGDKRATDSRSGSGGGGGVVKCSAMKLEGLECDDAVTISKMNGGKEGGMPTASAIAADLPVKGGRNVRLPPSGGDLAARRAGVGRAGARRRSSKGSPTDEDEDEELRYGPGIVNRLRCKYLSMTLRESQTRGVRPSLSSLRRAASMEDILDGPAQQQQQGKDLRGGAETQAAAVQSQRVGRYVKRTALPHRPPLNLQPEALKRARSVETLLRCELKSPVAGLLSPTLAKEDVIIIEGGAATAPGGKEEEVAEATEGRRSRKPSGLAEGELPPPDVVRQTLKIFEYSSPPTSPGGGSNSNKNKPAMSSARPPANGVAAPAAPNSVVVRAIPAVAIPPPHSPPHGPKPQLSPKPVILQMSGPKASPGGARVSPLKAEQEASPKKAPKPQQAVKDAARPSVLPIAPHPKTNTTTAAVSQTTATTTTTARAVGVTNTTAAVKKTTSSPTKPFKTSPSIAKATPQRPSPTEAKAPEVLAVSPTSVPNGQVVHEKGDGGPSSRTVSRSALENIRKDGLSIEFKFDGSQKPKAHLPGGAQGESGSPRQVGVIRPMTKPPTPPGTTVRRVTPPRSIAPLQTSGVQGPSPSSSTTSPTSSAPDVVKSTLTETEKEKNHINRVKSTEVPLRVKVTASPPKLVSPPAGATKLVTVVKEVPSVSKVEPAKLVQLKKPEDSADKAPAKTGLWDSRSRWNEQQNSVIFNFVARSEVPDYIENDGLIIRPRDRPRRNEPGSIWLRDATRGESGDDEEDDEEDEEEDVADAYGWVSADPPPPCNVLFEGDNVLINGRSNLRKNSATPSPGGTRKPRITFNDEATKTFEYPSESSFMDESPSAMPQASTAVSGSSSPSVHTPPPSSMAPSLATTGGSLSSYTPHKIQIGGDFQLGITRTVPQPSSSGGASPSGGAPSKESKQDEEEYLKPTEEGVTWSSETAADLLF